MRTELVLLYHLRAALYLSLALLVVGSCADRAAAAGLDELPLERWKELPEAERQQLNIAEANFSKQDWKVALAEYEKFLTRYDESTGAPYAQLKGAICQVNLGKPGAAIKEGFQAVIDDWPDSPEAIAAAYYIGKAYKEMGDAAKAKKAYRDVLQKHETHQAAVMAMMDLVEIALIENDDKTRIALWHKLVFKVKRTPEVRAHCEAAARQLASHCFSNAQFDEGVKALATSYSDAQIPGQIFQYAVQPIRQLTGDENSKAQGVELTELAVKYIKARLPADIAKPEQKDLAKGLWFAIAELYWAGRMPDKAAEVYETMLTKYGVSDDILVRLASWYKAEENFDRARETFLRLENKIEGQNQVAQVYLQQQRYDLAIPIFRQLAVQDEKHAIWWTAQVANAHFAARQFKEAIAAYEELVKIDPNNADSRWRFSIGHVYQFSGQFKEAITHFRRATNAPTNYLHMAQCHRALKEPKEAILLYSQLMTTLPNLAPDMMLLTAQTYEEAGQQEPAIKTYRQIYQKFPKSPQASAAISRLENEYKIIITKGTTTDE